jgi:hypothetical protein
MVLSETKSPRKWDEKTLTPAPPRRFWHYKLRWGVECARLAGISSGSSYWSNFTGDHAVGECTSSHKKTLPGYFSVSTPNLGNNIAIISRERRRNTPFVGRTKGLGLYGSATATNVLALQRCRGLRKMKCRSPHIVRWNFTRDPTIVGHVKLRVVAGWATVSDSLIERNRE